MGNSDTTRILNYRLSASHRQLCRDQQVLKDKLKMADKARRDEILRAKLFKLSQLIKNTNDEQAEDQTDQQAEDHTDQQVAEAAGSHKTMLSAKDESPASHPTSRSTASHPTSRSTASHPTSRSLTKLDAAQIKSIGAQMRQNRRFQPPPPSVYHLEVNNLSMMVNSGRDTMTTTYDANIGCCLRTSAYFPFFETNTFILDISLDLCQVGRDVHLPDFLQTSVKIFVLDQTGSGLDWLVGDERGVFHLPGHRDFGWLEVASVSLDWRTILKEKLFLLPLDKITFKFEITYHNSKGMMVVPVVLQNQEDSGSSTDSDSSSDEEDEDLELRESMPIGLVFHNSYIFPVSLASLANKDLDEWFPLIDTSDDWYLEFLGHSVKAVLVVGVDGTVDIFLDYFHGSCDSNLPECAIFSCQVHVIHPSRKKLGYRLGGNMQLFDMSVERCAYWSDNFVCSVNAGDLCQNGCAENNEIMLRFDFFT